MVVKVIELVGSSRNNWTEAVDNAVHEAAKTIHYIVGVEVTNFTANVNDGEINKLTSPNIVIFYIFYHHILQ